MTGIPCDVPVPKIYLQLFFFLQNRINSLSLETYLTNFVSLAIFKI
jgi:hypothetical protein